MTERSVQIGEASRQTSLSIDTIRYYEKNGLLPPPRRSSGRFRLYSTDDLKRLSLIRRTQELGFSLREIKQFIDLDVEKACPSVGDMVRSKIADVQEKIEILRQLETTLKKTLQQCERELLKPTSQRRCPVLKANTSPSTTVCPGVASRNSGADLCHEEF